MPTITGVITDYAEQKALDHLWRKVSWTFPTVYLGLLIATPTDAGGTEVTTAGTNGYARQACGTGGGSIFSAATARSITQITDVAWGPSTGGPWTNVWGIGVYDASTGGNLIAYARSNAAVIATTDSYRQLASDPLVFTFTAGTKWTTTILNALLDHMFGRTTMGAAVDVWVALYSGDPLGAGTEVTTAGTNGYARVALDDIMGAASGGLIQNSSPAAFGPASADWNGGASFDYFAVMSAATAGVVRGGAAMLSPRTILNGGSGSFAALAINGTLD
jgi:hypothetical protein